MTDISPPSGMKPKAKYFGDVGEDMINVDGAITLMMQTDTPQAKALYKLFRKHLAWQRKDTSLTEEKQREEALFGAFKEAGIRVNDMGKLPGTMDD